MTAILASIVLFMAGIGFAFAAVNINSASVEELDAVKGIGPGKAKAIVAYRGKNGPFKSVDELKGVKGFGDKSVAKLHGELTVADSASAPAKPAAKK
jgi:competence protein ComEA